MQKITEDKLWQKQWERLIHLIVTMTTGIAMLIAAVATVAISSMIMAIITIILMIMFMTYIWHYRKLENEVQAMYRG